VLKKLRILVALRTTDKMVNRVSSYCEITEYLGHIVDPCRETVVERENGRPWRVKQYEIKWRF